MSKSLREAFGTQADVNLDQVGNFLLQKGFSDSLCDIICQEIPTDSDMFCIEGQVLEQSEVADKLIAQLNRIGTTVWMMERR